MTFLFSEQHNLDKFGQSSPKVNPNIKIFS